MAGPRKISGYRCGTKVWEIEVRMSEDDHGSSGAAQQTCMVCRSNASCCKGHNVVLDSRTCGSCDQIVTHQQLADILDKRFDDLAEGLRQAGIYAGHFAKVLSHGRVRLHEAGHLGDDPEAGPS